MQSIPRTVKNSCKEILIDKISRAQSISVIPKIASPNQILPKQLQLSKPVSHLFIHDFQDIQSKSGTMQPLYNLSPKNDNNQKYNQRLFSLYQQDFNKQAISSRNRLKINKLQNLKDFFLQQSRQIVFLSRAICLSMNQSEKHFYRRLLSIQMQNFNESTLATEKYAQSLKKLTRILFDKQKFPFLCPQLNQNITQSSSYKNILLQSQSEDYLSFNDNFQCSNILMSKKYQLNSKNIPTYCICTRFDYQTASYGQWFYFKVKRTSKTQLIQQFSSHKIQFERKNYSKKFKFIICNMTKRYSMLGVQMKISICRNGIWSKQGQNIHYYQTCFKRGNKFINTQNLTPQQIFNFSKNHQVYYALQFDLELKQNEEIYVSYNQPYSLTKLSKLLDNFSKIFDTHTNNQIPDSTCQDTSQFQFYLKSQDLNSKINKNNIKNPLVFYKRQIICQTPLKNQIQCLTFSMKKSSLTKKLQPSIIEQNQQNQDRKIILIMARAHPIETAGSFVLEGFLNNLFLYLEYRNDKKREKQLQQYFESQNKGALFQNLLLNFVIKIIPMINPDGVILGNSRCNFHGFDLNRQWKKTTKGSSQQIYCLKRFLLKFKDKIEMVIDLHGHSKQKNVFAYGMHNFKNPFSTREFPYILSKLTQKNFLFDQCRFTRLSDLKPKIDSTDKLNVKENVKQGTARIWLFRKLDIPNIFTIENSYCGSIHSKYHYDSFSYGQIGKQILLGISLYFINFSYNKNQQNDKKNKKKKPLINKSFQEDKIKNQFKSTVLSMDQLKSFKDSIIFDLQSKQQNAIIGMQDINSSQSEDQKRLQDQMIQQCNFFQKKQKSISPNKSKSHHSIKKVYQQKINSTPIRSNRYSTKQTQQQKPYNFKIKVEKARQNIKESDISAIDRNLTSRINTRQKSRYMSNEANQKLRQISSDKKQISNHKSTIQLQKNVTLSVVELGWDTSKLIEQDKSQSQRFNHISNGLINFPLINFGNHMIFPRHSNSNLNEKINEKLHKKLFINSQHHSNSKFMCRKPSQNHSNANMQVFQKVQQRKNVTQFMKKIESNRKLQNQMVTTKKIEKYKEIIMKINGGKS